MSQISVPVSTDVFLRLNNFLKESGSPRDPVSAVEDAIEYWLMNADWKKETLLPETFVDESSRGYMWKRVFLPQGTLLRMRKTDGSFEYAKVEGDHPVYKGERLSPNQFALKVAGNARDAWRDVWVKRPFDQDYIRADHLRQTIG